MAWSQVIWATAFLSTPKSKNAVCALQINWKLLPFPFPLEKSCRNEQTIYSLSLAMATICSKCEWRDLSLIQHYSFSLLCWSDDISVICKLYHFCFNDVSMRLEQQGFFFSFCWHKISFHYYYIKCNLLAWEWIEVKLHVYGSISPPPPGL